MLHGNLRLLFSAALCFASSGAFALDIPTGQLDLKLHLSVVLQARAVESWDGDRPTTAGGASPNGALDTDYYIRRRD